MRQTPRILHVLPHPGGGGETYVDSLLALREFQFEKFYLSTNPEPRLRILKQGIAAQGLARHHALIHAHGEVASGLTLPAIAARRSVVTIHGLHLVGRLTGLRRDAAAAHLKAVVRAASATICVSEAELEAVTAIVGGERGLTLVRNGIEPQAVTSLPERTAAREALELAPDDVVGVYLASLDPHKDPVVAARAAVLAREREPRLVLLIAGDGPLRQDLETIAAAGPAVRLLGFQPKIRPILAASDFMVLPSRREGLSFSVLEAMSMAIPVVASAVPANIEAVGDAGLSVPPGNVEAFSEAFVRLAIDPAERQALGRRARARVQTQFSLSQMLDGTRAIYERVLQHRA